MPRSARTILLSTRRHLEEPRNPIAVLDLASYLRARGDTVDCYFLDQLENSSIGKRYDLVGLSILQATDEETPLKDAVWLKERFSTATVVGGKWADTASNDQKVFLKGKGLDLHIGPGEFYFFDEGKGTIDFENYPAWDRRDFETLKTVCMEVMTSRGCPFHCNFCHNTEIRISFFSTDRTVSNISLLLELGMKEIFIIDDIFTIKEAHMNSVRSSLAQRKISLANRVRFFTHVNFVNDAIVRCIREFDPVEVQIGIESGDDDMLKRMGKGFVHEKAFTSISALHAAGIKVVALFLVGFPGEMVQSLDNTLRFIKRIRHLVQFIWVSFYQPVIGTVGWKLAIEGSSFKGHGKRNTDVVYVAPSISETILRDYKRKMLNVFEWRLRRRNLFYRIASLFRKKWTVRSAMRQ